MSVDLSAAEECLLQQLCRHQLLLRYEISNESSLIYLKKQGIKVTDYVKWSIKTIIKRFCFEKNLVFAESLIEYLQYPLWPQKRFNKKNVQLSLSLFHTQVDYH